MASVLAIILYILGSSLDHLFHSDFFRVLPACSLLFLVPGYALLEFVPPRKFSALERLSLAVPLSLGLNAVILFVGYSVFHTSLIPSHVRTEIVATISLLSVASFSYRRFYYPQEPLFAKFSLDSFKNHTPLLVGAVAYVLFHGASFLAYPFLPEADGYSLITATRTMLLTGVDTTIGYRPFMLMDTNAFTSLSGMDPLTLFKYIFPLVLVVIIVPVYFLARRYNLSRSAQLVASLLPIAIPVIFQETEYIRPQTFVILTTPIVLWLLIRSLQERDWTLYGLAAFLAILSLEFHEFSLLLVITALLAALPAIWAEWQRRPLRVLLILLYLVIATYPYIAHLSSLQFGLRVLSQIRTSFGDSGFRWWFINNYVNTDGNQLGWPGWQAALYYGYNLGFILPLLLASYLFRIRNQPKGENVQLLPVWGFFLPAFFFAEISPRFGFAYLPDRAWLYVSLALCFFTVSWMSRFDSRQFMRSLVAASLLSGVVSVSVTVLKQGWVTEDEYTAAQWLQTHTPVSSQIISQTSNGPLINVYANRLLVSNPQFFFQSPTQENDYLSTLTNSPLSLSNTNFNEQDYLTTISTYVAQLSTVSATQLPTLGAELNSTVSSYVEGKELTLSIASAESSEPLPRPTYVLYSDQKFSSSLYGKRAWWRQENAYGANLTQLNRDPSLVQIYNLNGVIIWQYKSPS